MRTSGSEVSDKVGSEMRLKLLASGFALVAGLALSLPARAQPSIWDVARDPKVAKAYDALVRGEQLFALSLSAVSVDVKLRLDERIQQAFLESYVLNPGDSRAAILFAQHSSSLDVIDYARARDIALAAIELDPGSPRAAEAWFSIGILSAKLDDRDVEFDAYSRSLEVEWHPTSRSRSYLNRAESNMIAGRFERAIADYNRSLDESSDPDAYSLAHWGLAIAYERYGDLPSALKHALMARSVVLPPGAGARNPIDLPSVFFVPAYDRFYYKALGSMAAARAAKRPQVELFFVLDAVRNWVEYIRAAEVDGQPWIQNAERHRARLERRLQVLKKAPKGSAQESDGSPTLPPRR